MDNNLFGVMGAIVIIAGIFLFMLRAWKASTRSDSRYVVHVGDAPSALKQTENSQQFEVLYVATTHTANVLDRIKFPGLAHRASAMVVIEAISLEIAPRGEIATVLSPHQITSIGRSSVTIDKGVERDGLTAIEWTAFDIQAGREISVTSFFRIASSSARLAFEKALTDTYPQATNTLKEV